MRACHGQIRPGCVGDDDRETDKQSPLRLQSGLGGRSQQMVELVHARVRDLLDLFRTARFHGMWQHEAADRGQATRASGESGEVREDRRHDHDRRLAGELAFDRVVDTPRRA
jgi:hypothetical protein